MGRGGRAEKDEKRVVWFMVQRALGQEGRGGSLPDTASCFSSGGRIFHGAAVRYHWDDACGLSELPLGLRA